MGSHSTKTANKYYSFSLFAYSATYFSFPLMCTVYDLFFSVLDQIQFFLSSLYHSQRLQISCSISVLLSQLLTVCRVAGGTIIILSISAVPSPLTPFPSAPLHLSPFHWSNSPPPVCNCNIYHSIKAERRQTNTHSNKPILSPKKKKITFPYN